MKTNRVWIIVSFVLAISLIVWSAVPVFAQQLKPNIVFILTDNLGYGELGVYGVAKRIRDAAEMGDVMTLNAIAAEIKTHSDSCVPLSKQIIQMSEDFELDGILKLADALDTC